VRLKLTSRGISPGGEPLYRIASLSVSSRRLPGLTQRLSKAQNVCAVLEKINGGCRTTRPRVIRAEPWVLDAAQSRLGGRTGPTRGILVPKLTALRSVRGRSGASPYQLSTDERP
jgi:hypothetical protein